MPKEFRRIFGRVVREPKGFDDPTKQACAHAERGWEALAGGFALSGAGLVGAAAAGLAVPIVIPVLGIAAAASGLFKMNAKWGKEDPPRPDYASPVAPPAARFDLLLLSAPEIPLEFLRYVRLVEMSGRFLGATLEALEKSLGAAIDAERDEEGAWHFSRERYGEALMYGRLTSSVLRSTASASEAISRSLREWLPDSPQGYVEVSTILDAMGGDVGAGLLLAAGVDLELLLDPLPEDPGEQPLEVAISEAGRIAEVLAGELERWAEDELELGPDSPVPA